MPVIETIQQRFTQGEIDPKVIGRSDMDRYYGALAKATNIFTIPQGGFKRRPGMEFIDDVTALNYETYGPLGTVTSAVTATPMPSPRDDANPFTVLPASLTNGTVLFEYEHTSPNTLRSFALDDIYFDPTGATTVTDNDYLQLQQSEDGISWQDLGEPFPVYTAKRSVCRRLTYKNNISFIRLIVNNDASTPDVNELRIDGIYLVEEDYSVCPAEQVFKCVGFRFNIEQTYKFIIQNNCISIYQGTDFIIDIYQWQDLDPSNINVEFEADTFLIFNPNYQTKRLTRSGANDLWDRSEIQYSNIPAFNFVPITIVPGNGDLTPSKTEGLVKLTNSVAPPVEAAPNNIINFFGADFFGRVRITEVIGNDIYGNVIETLYGDTPATPATNWEIEAGYEPIWSAQRGWPRLGKFYQNRLYVDGGRSRPSVLYGSKVNDFFNFDFGTALDNEAVGPLSPGYDDIESIYPGRNLMIFTTSEEYIIPQSIGEPITPTTATILRQTSNGSEPGFQPEENEGSVMYIQRTGASIQEFVFEETVQAYQTYYVSLLSSHLVASPKSFALRRATNTEDGSYILLTRGNGNMTMANILKSQKVTSFFECETQGTYEYCGVDVSDMFFVTTREVEGCSRYYVEQFNEDYFTDCAYREEVAAPKATFTGLEYIEGKEVRVIADGSIMNTQTVTNGEITVERDVEEYVEIGLDFTPVVQDLPVVFQTQLSASALGRKKNISEVSLRLIDTAGIIVQDSRVYFRTFGLGGGASPLDKPTPKFTGVKRLWGFLGYSEDAQIVITQVDPLPMNVLEIKKRVRT